MITRDLMPDGSYVYETSFKPMPLMNRELDTGGKWSTVIEDVNLLAEMTHEAANELMRKLGAE